MDASFDVRRVVFKINFKIRKPLINTQRLFFIYLKIGKTKNTILSIDQKVE